MYNWLVMSDYKSMINRNTQCIGTMMVAAPRHRVSQDWMVGPFSVSIVTVCWGCIMTHGGPPGLLTCKARIKRHTAQQLPLLQPHSTPGASKHMARSVNTTPICNRASPRATAESPMKLSFMRIVVLNQGILCFIVLSTVPTFNRNRIMLEGHPLTRAL